MNGTKKTYFYLLITCTIVMFGIAAYLLVSGGSSHGTIWGGRYGNKLEGTINGYGVLLIAVGMFFCLFAKNSTYQLVNSSQEETLFSIRQTNEVVGDYFRSSNLLTEKKYMWKKQQ